MYYVCTYLLNDRKDAGINVKKIHTFNFYWESEKITIYAWKSDFWSLVETDDFTIFFKGT